MIELKLYNFNKKPNSTKRPLSSEGTVFSCAIKNVSSILSPVVDIAIGPSDVASYNYAYIRQFDRYYFITDIVYDQGIWSLSLSCDLLATYKEDLLNSEQYIIRSASDYDPNIIDTMYLTKNMTFWSRCESKEYQGFSSGGVDNPYGVRYKTIGQSSITGGSISDYFNASITTGKYVLGIVGNNPTGVDYYSFTYAGLKEFIRKTFAIRPSDMDDVSAGVGQALYNPIQYITMCKWYPDVAAEARDTLTAIWVGPYEVKPLTIGAHLIDIQQTPMFYIDIELPEHPDAVNYPYLKLSPFSEYNLYFQPFGNIPIDSAKIFESDNLTVTWTVDYTTGLSNLIVKQIPIEYIGNDTIIYNATAEYGVDIPISTLVTDFKTGAMISGLTWLKDKLNTANNAVSGEGQVNSVMNNPQYANAINAGIDIGKPVSINTSTIDKAADALSSYMGQLHTVGSSGSFLSYIGRPFVYAYFFDQAAKDPDRFGRPCYRKLILNNRSGYCLCSNAYINFTYKNPTEMEYNAIISMLNTGIYIEV